MGEVGVLRRLQHTLKPCIMEKEEEREKESSHGRVRKRENMDRSVVYQ